MSGNAAISAAKRRRGNQPSMNQVISGPPAPAPQLTPEQMLMKHNIQLQRIEKKVPEVVEELRNEIKSIVEKNNSGDENNSGLNVNALTEDMGYMGSRLQQIEEQLETLNKSLIQIQSFTMEMKTNLDTLTSKDTADAQVGDKIEVENEEVQVDNAGEDANDVEEENSQLNKKKRGRKPKKDNIVMEVEAELQG
jgi:hypothetical protein